MKNNLYHVDAFTDRPFAGNPAAVCLLEQPAGEAWMQAVAAEMNLSETAFVFPEQHGYRLRWFTPRVEVQLCGHATLAAAHVLWEAGWLPQNVAAEFHTLSGLLTATRCADWIELDFPARITEPAEPLPGLLDALNIGPVKTSRWQNIYLLELDTESAVRGLQPDFTLLGRLPLRSVIVTARSESSDYDIVSRYFAPFVGVDEDPVTGSAHCALAPYWARILDKQTLTGFQASSRGGVIGMRLEGDRVILRGQAVVVYSGVIGVVPA